MSKFEIGSAAQHTIKKIELVTKYVESWAQKLLNNPKCEKLVFIDCMCNCGEYKERNNEDNILKGTPYHVAKYFFDIASNYSPKKLYVVFNDCDGDRIDHLKQILKKDGIISTNNFDCIIENQDADVLLNKFSKFLLTQSNLHYLIFYDPFQAVVNWEILAPFFNKWGELIINHMVSDTIRSIPVVKSSEAIKKYESTYLTEFKDLLPCGSDVKSYEDLFERNIRRFRKPNRPYFVSFFPFFNSKNALVYDLVHCTSNIVGFKLYKECAWKVFDGQSSDKDRHGAGEQLTLFENSQGTHRNIDEKCYTLNDIVDLIIKKFSLRDEVPKKEIWELLDCHPVFPSDGFKDIISNMLKDRGFTVKRSSIVFNRKSK